MAFLTGSLSRSARFGSQRVYWIGDKGWIDCVGVNQELSRQFALKCEQGRGRLRFDQSVRLLITCPDARAHNTSPVSRNTRNTLSLPLALCAASLCSASTSSLN